MMVKIKSEALISKRQEKKYSQRQLPILSGLSDIAIFRMESEKYAVNYLRAKAVADALKCDVDEIIRKE